MPKPAPLNLPVFNSQDIYELQGNLCLSNEGIKKLMAIFREYRQYIKSCQLKNP